MSPVAYNNWKKTTTILFLLSATVIITILNLWFVVKRCKCMGNIVATHAQLVVNLLQTLVLRFFLRLMPDNMVECVTLLSNNSILDGRHKELKNIIVRLTFFRPFLKNYCDQNHHSKRHWFQHSRIINCLRTAFCWFRSYRLARG